MKETDKIKQCFFHFDMRDLHFSQALASPLWGCCGLSELSIEARHRGVFAPCFANHAGRGSCD